MQMQSILTNISIANQTAVPSQIRKLWQLRPGDKLLWNIKEPDSIMITPLPARMGSYMRGLGKNVWPQDAQKYVKTLREDRKLP